MSKTYCYFIKFKDDTVEFVYASYYCLVLPENEQIKLYDQDDNVIFITHWLDVKYIKRLGDRLNPEELLEQ